VALVRWLADDWMVRKMAMRCFVVFVFLRWRFKLVLAFGCGWLWRVWSRRSGKDRDRVGAGELAALCAD
jgi:hypothetical protein